MTHGAQGGGETIIAVTLQFARCAGSKKTREIKGKREELIAVQTGLMTVDNPITD